MNNDLLYEMLKRHEGLRLKPYRCPAGYWTIGYGWNMQAHPLPTDIAACMNVKGEITEDMAEWLLNISIDMATLQCRAIFPGFKDFSERRQAALVDFVFNLGAAGAMKFKKMLAAIAKGEWEKAADEMQDSEWFRQVKDRSVEIIKMIREG